MNAFLSKVLFGISKRRGEYIMKKETRAFTPTKEMSYRAETEGEKRYLTGYAAVFNSRSKLIYENEQFFYEMLERTAFDAVLADKDLNAVMTFNHDRSKILGRNVSGTLELSTDDKGLKFRVLVPDTTLGNDVYEMVKRGDYYENSFVFTVNKEGATWSRTEEGDLLRVIRSVSGLYDVAIAVNGAYSDTVVDAELIQRAINELDGLGKLSFAVEKGVPTFIESTIPAGKYNISFKTVWKEETYEYETTLVVSEDGDAKLSDFKVAPLTDGPMKVEVNLDKDNMRIQDEDAKAKELRDFRADTILKGMRTRLLELN